MKILIIKLLIRFLPKEMLNEIVRVRYLEKHQYPLSTLIHRKKAKVIYEIEFNWFDDNLTPVSLVRETQSGKQFSVSHLDMYEFKEYQGRDVNAGNTI
jgi:hypothetical protein